MPDHSSQQFDFVLSFDYLEDVQAWVKTWNNTGPHNFVLLKKGTDINAFNKKIANVITSIIAAIPAAVSFCINFQIITC